MTRRVLILIGLVLIAAVARWQMRAIDVTPTASLDQLPLDFGVWHGHRVADYAPDVVAALGVDEYVNRGYVADDGAQASLYVGYYRSQEQGASIHSPLNCLPGAGWEPERVDRVPFGRGTARRLIVRKGERRFAVVYWYQTPTRVEGDEYRSRLYTALDTLRYGRNDAALVRVMTPIGADAKDETRAADHAFGLARLIVPYVQRVMFPTAPLPAPANRSGPA
jgi:EpsI family protein